MKTLLLVLIIIILLFQNSVSTNNIIVIDNCQYIQDNYGHYLIHKANCTNVFHIKP